MSVPPSSSEKAQPVVRLKPKTDARRIRHGFPWIYDNQIVTDRRTRAVPAGSIVRLEDADRAPLGIMAYNPGSRIMGQMLDSDPDTVVDKTFWQPAVSEKFKSRFERTDLRGYGIGWFAGTNNEFCTIKSFPQRIDHGGKAWIFC